MLNCQSSFLAIIKGGRYVPNTAPVLSPFIFAVVLTLADVQNIHFLVQLSPAKTIDNYQSPTFEIEHFDCADHGS